MYKATINVTLKKSILDPQGTTVLHALHSLGHEQAKELRIGKYFELVVDEIDAAKAEAKTREMCDQLLINPVIEDYTFELKKQS